MHGEHTVVGVLPGVEEYFVFGVELRMIFSIELDKVATK